MSEVNGRSIEELENQMADIIGYNVAKGEDGDLTLKMFAALEMSTGNSDERKEELKAAMRKAFLANLPE